MLMDECWVLEVLDWLNIWLIKLCLLMNKVLVVIYLLLFVDGGIVEEKLFELLVVIVLNLLILVCLLGMGVDMYIVFIFFEVDKLLEVLIGMDIFYLMWVFGVLELCIMLLVDVLKVVKNIYIVIIGVEKWVVLDKVLMFDLIDVFVVVVFVNVIVYWVEK